MSTRLTLSAGKKAAKSFITKASRAWGIPASDFHIAGSIRRKEPEVGDVDLVVVVGGESQEIYPGIPIPGVRFDHGASKARTYFLPRKSGDVKVNVWFTPEAHLGGMMLFATGSGRYNINLRNRAKKMGMKLTRYGISKGDRVLASRTEEEIYALLDKRWYAPEERTENAMRQRGAARAKRKRAAQKATPPVEGLFDLDAYLKGSKASDWRMGSRAWWKAVVHATDSVTYEREVEFESPSGDKFAAADAAIEKAYELTFDEWDREINQDLDTDVDEVKELYRTSIRELKGSTARNTSVMLATKWKPTSDPKGWWASEKFDGLRAVWDGKKFITRYGNTFRAPPWFTADFPKKKLDGELWAGRGNFQQASSVVRSHAAGERWKGITYMVFDAPSSKDFEDRQADLKALFRRKKPRHAKLVTQTRVRNDAHLAQLLKRAEAKGGEGIMLREPGSPWRVGRWPWIAKVKSLDTAEARVVGYTKGKGSFSGMVGALIVAMKDGKEFKISSGLDYNDRMNPPKVGAMVEYAYQGKSDRGIPKLARYIRVRKDVPKTRARKVSSSGKFDLDAELFDLDAFLGLD